jgi:anaerobic selenocysteine-containing dehydrogenase
MAETVTTFCRICEALCGLRVTVEGGKIQQIDPDPEHVATDGFACVKGLKQHRLYDSPDRVRFPMKRVGRDWQRVSWEQALAEIGAKLKALLGVSGPDAIAMYVGTAAGFSILHPIFAPGARQVRALFVTGGNPLITMPNAARLRDALAELELLVVLDIFRNETASLAHYVLPCTSPFERADLPFIFR